VRLVYEWAVGTAVSWGVYEFSINVRDARALKRKMKGMALV